MTFAVSPILCGNFMKAFEFLLISIQNSLTIETAVDFPTANVLNDSTM